MLLSPKRALILLCLLALLSQGARAFLLTEPDLWDVSYYRGVARGLLDGTGAPRAVWSLLTVREHLGQAADLYWMPLPSRVLMPGLLLWPARGELLVTTLLAALWAPLSYGLARRLGGSAREALAAGLLVTLGGVWARQASLPDCFGLAGALGGAAFLGLLHGRAGLVALLAFALALTRGEGALLGLALALGFQGWRRVLVAAAGPLGSLLWTARNVAVAGHDALLLKQATTRARDIQELLLGTVPDSLGLGERLQLLVDQTPQLALYWASSGGLLGVLALAAGLGRARPLARSLLACWLLVPPLTVLLAPGAAAQGALYRTGAALAPALAAVAALGMARLSAWGQEKRGYHPAFLPVMFLLPFLLFSLQQLRVPPARALPPDLCAPLAPVPAGAPVLAWHPLAVAERCGHPAIVLLRAVEPARLQTLIARGGVAYALLPPAGWARADLAQAEDMPRLLPGWREGGPGLWVAPEAEVLTPSAP